MIRGDPALMAALQHGMRGDQGAVFEDPHLIGERMHFDDPLPGRIGDAVKIAADAHHAFMRDPPFQLEDRAEGRQRQNLRCGFSSAKASLTTRWVVACTRGLATVSSQCRNWAFRSSRLRKERARKKSSRI